MTISEHDYICLSCKYRKFDLDEGLLCSITNKKSDFEISCINFKKETESKEKENTRILSNQQKSEKGRKKFIIYSGIYIFINLLTFLISYFYDTGNSLIYLIDLLINLLFLYFIHKGKNWVRIVFSVFIVFNFVQFGIVDLINESNDFNVIVYLIINSCYVFQIYLLFLDSDFKVFFKQQRILNQR